MSWADGCRRPEEHAVGQGRVCSRCRREVVVEAVLRVDSSLPVEQVAAAVDAVADHPTRLRSLAAAAGAHPDGVRVGAPPIMGRLVVELIARGARPDRPDLRRLRRRWSATDLDRRRRDVPAVRAPPAHPPLHQLRAGQAGRRPDR